MQNHIDLIYKIDPIHSQDKTNEPMKPMYMQTKDSDCFSFFS